MFNMDCSFKTCVGDEFRAKKLSILNLVWSGKNFKCETFTDEWFWGWMTIDQP